MGPRHPLEDSSIKLTSNPRTRDRRAIKAELRRSETSCG
jgi:hypothetical protein